MNSQSDERIDTCLERIAKGDRAALRTLFHETAASLLGLATRLAGDRSEGEAIVQDCFVTIWQNAQHFDRQHERGWVWVITMLRVVAFRRIRLRGRELDFDPRTQSSSTSIAEIDSLVERLDDDTLKHCLMELGVEERRSILMAYLDGFSIAQIAERMASPLDHVRSWIRDGMVSLWRCLS